jgi:hypothetical protein
VTRRGLLASGGVLATLWTLLVVAEPARACSCDSLNPEEELARGGAVAIVTRIDSGPGTAATFRVERSYGADLPPTLAGQVDSGMDCHVQVFPQEVTAVVFRRAGGWVLPQCSETGRRRGAGAVLG